MNICPKCQSRNPASASWCEVCGEMLIPTASDSEDRAPLFHDFYYEPESGKAKFIRFVAILFLLAGLYFVFEAVRTELWPLFGEAYANSLALIRAILPASLKSLLILFATIAGFIGLRSFAEIVENLTVTRSMNEFILRKLDRLS